MKKLFKFLSIILFAFILIIGSALAYIKIFLPDVGPAPDITEQVKIADPVHGKYLAEIYACMHCHTKQDKEAFGHPVEEQYYGSGGTRLGYEEGLPGNFYAPNLTPYNLGDWTDGEIYRAVTQGVSKDGRPLFPIMPYPNYAQIDPKDIYDIIAFLRTLEPIENDVPASEPDFPVNILVHTMPKAQLETFQKPEPTDKLAYGKYLVTAASCVDCHITRDDKGNPVPGMFFAGNNAFKMIDGSIVRSANLTPDMNTGIGSWTEEVFIQRFKTFADPSLNSLKVPHGQFNTPMPWQLYSKMSEEELKAIFTYLQSLEPVNNPFLRFASVMEQTSE